LAKGAERGTGERASHEPVGDDGGQPRRRPDPALGINDRGDIVGAYIEAVPGPYRYHETGRLRGFVMREGRFTPIDFPGGEGTKVSGINNRVRWSATTTPTTHGEASC
jgi:hypothetical protein